MRLRASVKTAGAAVIDIRRRQRNFGDGFIRETVDELWEDWMRHADAMLADEGSVGPDETTPIVLSCRIGWNLRGPTE
jgi:hypothetical protein